MSDNLHPEGYFDAEIVDHGITKSQSGTEQVAVKFQTDHGYITGWFPLTDKAIEYTVEKLQNMGFRGRSFSMLNDGRCLAGHRCNITVAHEEYRGNTNARVKRVNPEGYEGAEIKRDEAAARSASRFDALLRKMNPDDGAARAPAGVTHDHDPDFGSQEDSGDSDIPF
jgi:hypothetical protein